MEDADIVIEVLAGNRDAYAHLVRKYESRVRGYCLMMLREYSMAEDAAQEVFIKAFQALSKFKWNASFSTWLYRIAANHCNDVLRKISRRKTESWDALLEKEGEKIEALLTAPSLPEEATDEQTRLVSGLLSGLPEKSRQVLIWREVYGLSYQELAETLDCTVDSIKARLKRARQELEVKARHFLKPQNV